MVDNTGAWQAGDSNAGSAGVMVGRALAWLGRELVAERDRWPLWLPVAFGVGICVYFALPLEPPAWVGVAGFGLAVLCGLAVRRQTGLLMAAIVLAVLTAGFAAAQLRVVSVAAPYLDERLGPVPLTGQILEIEPRAAGKRILLHRLDIRELPPAQTPERARVLVSAKAESLQPGDWVRLTAVLRPPPEPAAPGAFDFARQAYFDRLGAVGFAFGRPRVLEPEMLGPGTGPDRWSAWRLWWSDLRLDVAGRIEAVLPGATGAVAAALMTGVRGAIPPPVIDAMRDSGLAHLLAISGLHVGLVAGLVFFAVRLLLAAAPAVALRHPIKKWAAVAASAGAFCYLFLVGATVPTQRAFLMLGLVLLAVVLDRSAVSMRLVAWAAFAVLAITPESVLSASFQMSFAAVAALIAGYEELRDRRGLSLAQRPLAARAMLYFAAVGFTSVLATAATGPFAIYHFNRFAVYSVAANLIAVPATALWIMPCALAAFVLMPFGAERLALIPMGWGINLVIGTAETVASWPGAVTPVMAMPPGGLILVILGGLWLCLWRRPWRLAGIPFVCTGLLTLALARPPDVLVSGDGRLFAVRGPDGDLILSSGRVARFTGEVWLRRNGQKAGSSWVAEVPERLAGALACDRLGCIYKARGQTVALASDGGAVAEDCRLASVVVSLEPIRGRRCREPGVVIDRFDLWREGAHALWLSPGKVRVESVRDVRGKRPWVARRGWD